MDIQRTSSGIIEITDCNEKLITESSASARATPHSPRSTVPFTNSVLAIYGQGQKKSGVENGPFLLSAMVNKVLGIHRNALAIPKHPETVRPSTDLTSVAVTNSIVPASWQKDYENLYAYLASQSSPYVLIGGDHSIGQSSVAASIARIDDVNNLYVLWIDAHADMNTMEASPSKNIHGQPMAAIMGYENAWFPIKAILPTTNLLYYGIRDLDPFEVEMIHRDNIYNTRKLEEILEKILEIKRTNVKARFHVSFDVDALDPSVLSATGCLVEDGLMPKEVATVINAVKDICLALDLTEFNPSLGDVDQSLMTVQSILEGISNPTSGK
jgi:arginase